MLTFIRCICYVATTIGSVLLLDHKPVVAICIALGLWFVIIIILLPIDDDSSIRRDIKILGIIFYTVFFNYIFFGKIHVKHLDEKHVAVYSPFWQKKTVGEGLDTLRLRSHIESSYTTYKEGCEDFYFLHVADSIAIYNRLRPILKIQQDYSIIQYNDQDKGIYVDLIQDANGQVYSLDGDPVDEHWKPRIHDTTPVDNTPL